MDESEMVLSAIEQIQLYSLHPLIYTMTFS